MTRRPAADTDWHPGLMVGTYPPGYSDESMRPAMLIQRAPGKDGWLAIDAGGVIFNLFDSIARLYHPAGQQKRAVYVRAAQQPREWFGVRRVRLNLKPMGVR